MTLIEKLNLFNLSEEEKEKAKQKFLATLALVNAEELNDVVSYLESQNVYITKAREIKVVSNSKDELSKKFSILSEVHESELYRQEPVMLNKNVIDIYKKIKYCIQVNKPYKKEDGTYESFLFNENLWQQEFNAPTVVAEESPITFSSLDDSLVTVVPPVEETVPIIDDIKPISDFPVIDEEPVNEIETKTTNFADIRKQLEDQLKELDSIKSENVISFDDIESETYEMGRTA